MERTIQMIAKDYKTNLETLRSAFKNDDVALIECKDVNTGKPVITICAMSKSNGEYIISPLAKMFDSNPYEELIPPDIGGQ